MADRKYGDERSRQQYEKRAKRRAIRELHTAISRNEVQQVQELLTPDIDVNFQYSGVSALQIAVTHGFEDICRILIKRGADVNKCNAEYNSLLNMAAWRGYYTIAEMLVEAEADTEVSNDRGASPVNTAAYKGYSDLVGLLVTSGCNLDKPNGYGQTPLNNAAKEGHLKVAEVLVQGGCDMEWPDNDRQTPLITAAENNKLHLVRLLTKSGCNLNCRERYGMSALHFGARLGHQEIVMELISAKAELDTRDNKGASPVIYAVTEQHVDIVRLLAEAGCDLDIHEYDRTQASIHIAVSLASQYFGSTDKLISLVKLLVSSGCDIDSVDKNLWSPLYQAAQSGASEIVELLLSNGAKVDGVTDTVDTLLQAAVFGNSTNIMRHLLDAGCDVNRCNIRNELPLYAAIDHRSKIELIRMLLEAGSETDVCESVGGQSPLFCAISHDYTDAVDLLIKAGCDINQPNKDGNTPLWMACNKGNESMVEKLLARPDIEINTGISHVPLHAAAVHGYTNIAEILLKAGANVNQLSDICISPLYLAADMNHMDVAKVLIRYGANASAPHRVKLPQKCCSTYSDPHPHMESEPLYAAVKNDNFLMVKIILLCTPRMPYYVLRTLKDLMFRTSYAQSARIPPHIIMQYAHFFTGILSRPRRLHEECRGVIRENLPGNPADSVQLLPLPTKLREYVAMKGEIPT